MEINFKKYHGIGNDFILIDCRINNNLMSLIADRDKIKKLCDRNFAIGADGIIFILKPNNEGYINMRIINSDGSEAEMCGNGLRCLMRFMYDEKQIELSKTYKIETLAGIINSSIEEDMDVLVDMGKPVLNPESIPTTLKLSARGLAEGEINLNDKNINVLGVGMGNPHMITIVDEIHSIPFEIWGKILEKHHTFPSNTNVHFVEIVDRKNINIRVWERGCGATLACGTGACACLVACYKLGLIDNKAKVNLPGGSLNISWPNSNSSVFMKGPAENIYSGFFNYELNNELF